MTRDEIAAIRERRRVLLERIARERVVLAQSVDELAGPIGVADRALAVGRYLKGRPLLSGALGIAAGFAAGRTGRRLRRLGLTRLWWLPGALRMALALERATRPRSRSTAPSSGPSAM